MSKRKSKKLHTRTWVLTERIQTWASVLAPPPCPELRRMGSPGYSIVGFQPFPGARNFGLWLMNRIGLP